MFDNPSQQLYDTSKNHGQPRGYFSKFQLYFTAKILNIMTIIAPNIIEISELNLQIMHDAIAPIIEAQA